LRDERNGFAIASYQHMQEIEEWKRTICRLESEVTHQKDCSSMTTDTTSACTLDTTSLDETDAHTDADDDHVSVKTGVDEWKERYDELVDKINDLAEENEELLTKCHQLELASLASSFKGNTERRVSFDDGFLAKNAKGNEEGGKQQPMQLLEKRYKESVATIDALQAENDMLHKSIDEAMEDSCGVNEVNQYCQQQLASITEKLEQTTLSKEVIEKELQRIKEQNKALSTEAKEAKFTMEHYEQEMKELESCRMNAYHTCEVLQKEIDFLHERLDSSIEEHDEQLYRWSINEY
jgi:chromosome segregation ATPase